MNLSKYGFPYLGDGSEKWRSYPHIVPKNLDAIALIFSSSYLKLIANCHILV
jgi:hypothetical protein